MKLLARLMSMFKTNGCEEYYNPLKKYSSANIAELSCMGT